MRLFACFFLLFIFTLPAHAARYALVIGNGDYPGKNYLGNNPGNDARAIGAALQSVGFKVTRIFDIRNKTQFKRKINAFAKQLGANDEVVFYYSGHGIQVKGKNYLLPIRAEMVAAGQVEEETLSVDYVLGGLTRAGKGVVIIDACRDNPFKSIFKGDAPDGLKPQSAPANFLVAFAADENQRAFTGKGSENSPYVEALKDQITQPGLSVFKVFTKV
jgi:uncharacterized caspase-like protein